MPQIIRDYAVETRRGEITVNINLVLTINQDGGINITAAAPAPVVPKKREIIEEEDRVEILIPDWDPIQPNDLLDFGKEVLE